MVSLLFAFIFAAAAQECPVPSKMANDLSPATIKGYLQTNKAKVITPRDLVCCIARDQNVEIAIAQQSISAQSSDPENPRVLMITRDSAGQIKSIMSINSGAAHLPQKDSVEMMYNNQGGKKLEFYDIDFSSTKNPMGSKNPESCMACHGNTADTVKFGPRPIFDTHPWARFVGSETNNRCENMKRLNKSLETIALKAVAEKPVYSCIKDKKRIDLDTLEQSLAKLNNRKIALSLQSTPDYNKFKYINVAADVCDLNIEEWIPKNVLDGMNQRNGLSAAMAKANSVDELIAAMAAANTQRQQRSLQEDKRLRGIDPNNIGAKAINYSLVSDSDLCQPGLDKSELYRAALTSPMPMNLTRYYADDIANGDSSNGLRRFLFESRGIDISQWQMLAYPGYETSTLNLWMEIVRQEPRSSSLSQLLYPLLDGLEKDFFVIKSLPEDKAQNICNELKRLSLAAFADGSPKTATPPTSVEH